MSNMESILSVGQGATRALGAGGGRRQGAGDTPRSLTFWSRTWGEGAVALMGRLQRPGVGFFFFSSLLLVSAAAVAVAAASAAAILECGEGQSSLWTDGDN